MNRLSGILAVAMTLGVAGSASASPIFADSATVVSVTFFGSGILTGAPDDGGATLSDTLDPPTALGSIVAGFSTGLLDGPGDDLVIYDCCPSGPPSPAEMADVFVSSDGVAFTFLGLYGPTNSFDFAGVFASPVFFVRILNTSETSSPDIDAFQGNFAVPEPAALLLLGAGLVGGGLQRRRRNRA